VRHAPRPEDGITWRQPEALIASPDHILAREAVKPFVFRLVIVLRRPDTSPLNRLFRDKQRAAGVFGRNLDVQQVSARQFLCSSEAIRARGNLRDPALWLGLGGLSRQSERERKYGTT
jgi:hypothetical protein